MKLEIFKNKKKFRKGGFHTNPDICWEIVMYTVFAVVTGILIFSFLLFQKTVSSFDVQEVYSTGQATLVTKQKINGAQQYFIERAEKSSQIISSPSPIVDPAL